MSTLCLQPEETRFWEMIYKTTYARGSGLEIATESADSAVLMRRDRTRPPATPASDVVHVVDKPSKYLNCLHAHLYGQEGRISVQDVYKILGLRLKTTGHKARRDIAQDLRFLGWEKCRRRIKGQLTNVWAKGSSEEDLLADNLVPIQLDAKVRRQSTDPLDPRVSWIRELALHGELPYIDKSTPLGRVGAIPAHQLLDDALQYDPSFSPVMLGKLLARFGARRPGNSRLDSGYIMPSLRSLRDSLEEMGIPPQWGDTRDRVVQVWDYCQPDDEYIGPSNQEGIQSCGLEWLAYLARSGELPKHPKNLKYTTTKGLHATVAACGLPRQTSQWLRKVICSAGGKKYRRHDSATGFHMPTLSNLRQYLNDLGLEEDWPDPTDWTYTG